MSDVVLHCVSMHYNVLHRLQYSACVYECASAFHCIVFPVVCYTVLHSCNELLMLHVCISELHRITYLK